MGQKIRKIKKYILPAIVLLIAGLFLLNFHLTKRLEKILKKELIQRTEDATDGFYRLSFDHLSISLFKGELKLKGIRLTPDSAIFRKWADLDSLPQTYISAQIGLIDFKGVNLTWRWSYKQLHFNSFEIKSPQIQIFESYYSSRTVKKTKYTDSKTLYELISPYIDVLSVKTLNLENASVSFTVENPAIPIVYALSDVSFHAYDFRLDKNSSDNGKLLYCDNFDFTTNRKQTLLVNNDFNLDTDSIRLSTQDSIIYIKNIRLDPQENLWMESKQIPDSYLNALIQTVQVKGIHFIRKDALNYLTARSFQINTSDIKVYGTKRDNKQDKDTLTTITHIPASSDTDSLVQSLSLYDLISPVLHSVAINHIGIGNTSLQYIFSVKDSTDIYKLNNFDFQANDFLVDSVSEEKHGLWYSRSFAFEATGIEGSMAAHNHRFSVKRMALNTENGEFNIEKVHLQPLSTQTQNDYMAGSIDSINIRGLSYDKGVNAELFKIDRPVIKYVKATPYDKSLQKTKKKSDSQIDIEGIFNPFLNFLSIKKMNLNRANITLEDKSGKEPMTYKLNNFNFFATNILFNENTGKNNWLLFDYDNIGFRFNDFDNYLPGKQYRLSIKRANFSTAKGVLQLNGIKLIPQIQTERNLPETAIHFSTPLIYIDGLTHLPQYIFRDLKVNTFVIDSPAIGITQKENLNIQANLKKLELKTISWDSLALKLGSANFIEPTVDIHTTTHTDTINSKTKQIQTDNVYKQLSHIARQISLNKLNIINANIHYEQKMTGRATDSVWNQQFSATNLMTEGMFIDNINRKFSLSDIHFNTQNLEFPLDNGFYTLKIGDVELNKTDLSVNHIHLVSTYPKMEFAYKQPKHKDWFDVRVGNLKLKEIDLPSYFSDKIIRIGEVSVNNTLLQNFKNQKIDVPHHIVPMIYSGLQKAPVKIDFKQVQVNNFSVIYEELAKKGTQPGKLYFTDMNGVFTGFTNIVTSPQQYIRLDANGRLMGKGYFTATWQLPVDSLNDLFLLNARMDSFDLNALNELITPLASAEVQSGTLKSMEFSTEATSKVANVNMLFLYNDLKANLLKDKNGEITDNKILSRLANLVIRHDNPDKQGKNYNNPRHSHVFIERDPYHSTFNYLWQILRPALIESVGVSKKKQDTAKGVMSFITKVKNFFRHSKKQSNVTEQNIENRDSISNEFEFK